MLPCTQGERAAAACRSRRATGSATMMCVCVCVGVCVCVRFAANTAARGLGEGVCLRSEEVLRTGGGDVHMWNVGVRGRQAARGRRCQEGGRPSCGGGVSRAGRGAAAVGRGVDRGAVRWSVRHRNGRKERRMMEDGG